MRLVVPMAALLLVVMVACGGESKPTPAPTATSAPSPTPSPTVTPASTPSPTPTSSPSPTPSPTITPAAEVVRERSTLTPEPVAVEEGKGKGLTPEQEACLVEAIGEDWKLISDQRPPTSDELDALVGCGIMEPQPSFDLLPEASAPAGLGTVAWPNNVQESSALFESLPSEIVMGVTVHDLTKGAFFPTDTNAGQFVALYAQGSDWEVVDAGREGDLAWVHWKTGDIHIMQWGNAPSSIVFQAMAIHLTELMALVEAMVSAASE